MSVADADGPRMSKDEVLAQFTRMRQDEQAKRAKIQELSQQVAEFRMVIETLRPVDPERRCYHQIGAVLAERTVKEVLPVVESNHDSVVKLLSMLEGELTKSNQERVEFQRKYGIQIVPQSLLSQAQRVVQQSPEEGDSKVA